MIRAQIAGGLLAAIMLAGCSSDRLAIGEPGPQQPDMDGRWILAAPSAPTCGMNFTAAPDGYKGTVVPEGGCPERFFMSRRWIIEQNALVIHDDNNNALARLPFADGRFAGQSTAGTPLTLSRPPTPQ